MVFCCSIILYYCPKFVFTAIISFLIKKKSLGNVFFSSDCNYPVKLTYFDGHVSELIVEYRNKYDLFLYGIPHIFFYCSRNLCSFVIMIQNSIRKADILRFIESFPVSYIRLIIV